MDNLLSTLARSIGRILGKFTCGLDCSSSEFGFAEYIILFFVFILAFLFSLKFVNYLKNK